MVEVLKAATFQQGVISILDNCHRHVSSDNHESSWPVTHCARVWHSVTLWDRVWQLRCRDWKRFAVSSFVATYRCIMYHFVPWSGFVPSPPVNPSTLSKTYRFFLVSLPFSVQPILIFSIAIIKRCWLLCVYCLFLLILPPFICQFAVFQLLLKSPPATLWFPSLIKDVWVLRL